MKKSVLVAVLAVVGLCSGCLIAPTVPPTGVITFFKAPLDIDLQNTAMNQNGKSSTHNVLGLVAWGDASVHGAAAAGNIGTVDHADYEYWNILGIYQRFTTVVYGQ